MLDLRNYVAVAATGNFPSAPSAGGISLTIPTNATSNYDFAVAVPDPAASGPLPTFKITATPKGQQAVDGVLTLNSAGVKTPAGKW